MVENAAKVLKVNSWKEVDVRGKEICELRTRLEVETAKMNAEIETVKARFHARLTAAKEHVVLRETAIADFYRSHQAELGATRTYTGTWVTVRARLTSKLCTVPKWTWEKVLDVCKRLRGGWVRTKEEVDKEAVKAAVRTENITDQELRTYGMRMVDEDSITIEPIKAAVGDVIPADTRAAE
jgi:phage host-nuclease inhibitor protein Gam